MANDPVHVFNGGPRVNPLEADEEIRLDFSFSDSFPLLVYTFAVAGYVSGCQMSINTVFDGTGALTVGHSSDNDSIMETIDIDLTEVAIYEVVNDEFFSTPTAINIYSTLSGTTTGTATIILQITR